MTYYIRRNVTTVTFLSLRSRLSASANLQAPMFGYLVPVDGAASVEKPAYADVLPLTESGVVAIRIDDPATGHVDLAIGEYRLFFTMAGQPTQVVEANHTVTVI